MLGKDFLDMAPKAQCGKEKFFFSLNWISLKLKLMLFGKTFFLKKITT